MKHERADIPLKIYFVRHGQSVSAEGESAADPPLTELGALQAGHVARRLSGMMFDHIYCSSAQRARQTCAPILAGHEGVPRTYTEQLMEISKYLLLTAPADAKPEEWNRIESENDLLIRFANHLCHYHNPGQTILVVAHGNLIVCLLAVLGGRKPYQSVLLEIGNTSVTILDVWPPDRAVLKLANCTSHLGDDLRSV